VAVVQVPAGRGVGQAGQPGLDLLRLGRDDEAGQRLRPAGQAGQPAEALADAAGLVLFCGGLFLASRL